VKATCLLGYDALKNLYVIDVCANNLMSVICPCKTPVRAQGGPITAQGADPFGRHAASSFFGEKPVTISGFTPLPSASPPVTHGLRGIRPAAELH